MVEETKTAAHAQQPEVPGALVGELAAELDHELDWFGRVLETRINLYFGHDSPYSEIDEIQPPELKGAYGRFLQDLGLGFDERIVLILTLVPHLRPQLLDLFFTQNANNARFFTEFGGRNGHPHQCFLPTGETALFILTGGDLGKRLSLLSLFDADHPFAGKNVLCLEAVPQGEPAMSGILCASRETIDLATAGTPRPPRFGFEFPAKKIESDLDWDDLVLDAYTMEQVLDIKTWIDHGDTLLYGLGLRRRLKPGYRALFHGPSGTGKTLTASLLGKVSGLDVYRIDLSLVVSKYIGETEKNLDKVFSRAENRNWILFFDEADALFGKRTEIRDSHDRYANQEVSYLLQRVEDYRGIVILATNRLANLDEAFARRFHTIIPFPMPNRRERLRLWRQGFAEALGPGPDVDLDAVAERYDLSGGAVANAIRHATLMALRKGAKTVAAGDILEGIRKELQKEGRTS